MAKQGFGFSTIQSIAVAYIVIWSLSPPLEIDMIYRVLALGAVFVWAACWLLRENPIELDKNQIVSIFFLFVVVGVTFITNGDFKGILKQIAFFMLVICFIINRFYEGKWGELKWIVPIVLVLLIVWNYKTIQALIDDPTIARRIVRDDESIYPYLRQGVGGYSLVYPQVCLSSAIFIWTLKAFKNNKFYFVIGVLWIASFVRIILLAGYSIAIFASVVGLVLTLFYNGKSGYKAFAISAVLFAVIMLSIFYIEDFRNWLLEIFDGTAVAKKINDLMATGDSGNAEGSIALRITRYVASLEVMVKYPIIGALWREGGGGHSAFLDIIARYGLFGGWFFIKSVCYVPEYYKNRTDTAYIRRLCNATMVIVMIVSLLNSLTYAMYCAILLVMPLFFEDIVRWNGVKNEDSLDD